MGPERLPRQLAAILYADMVGFSRLTEVDEETTFRNVRDRLGLFAETIEKSGGKVISYAGDAVLAIFSSATDALICATNIQKNVEKKNAALPDDKKLIFRIGLNLGDIIQDKGNVFGDGVNVAARLEPLAEPGGICISGSFHDAVVMKLPFDFEFMGEQQVKNISKPIRAYQVRLQAGADIPKPSKANYEEQKQQSTKQIIAISVVTTIFLFASVWAAYKINEISSSTENGTQATLIPATENSQKSIIILPFNDLSSQSDQEYFVDGITEDIITDLSRLNNLQVLARNTSFKYKATTVDPQVIGKELNVSHLLEGSVRKAGNTIRITAQLIDTKTARHIWADRYDRKLADIFAVQDDVTKNIVEALALHLTDKDKAALAHKDTNNIEAYELFLQGQTLYRQRTKEANQRAQAAYEKAIKLDPSYARSYGALAISITQDYISGWAESTPERKDRALELARKAVSIDEKSQQAYWALGFTHLFRREHQLAVEATDQAIKISPSFADAYALLAFINNYIGDVERAERSIKLINKGMKLNPHYSYDYPWNLGFAYYIIGDYDSAMKNLTIAIDRNPNIMAARLFRAATYAALEQQDDAEWEIEQVLTLYPNQSVSSLKQQLPIANPEMFTLFLERLRQAGLPE